MHWFVITVDCQYIGFLLPAGSRLDGVHRATFIIM